MKMLLAVGLFGLMTVVFAYSRWVPLSVLCPGRARRRGHDLGLHPAEPGADRHPGPNAGRVSAVATLFIGASNELGEFESGVVARVLGPVGSVAFGGGRGDGRDGDLGLAVPAATGGGSSGLDVRSGTAKGVHSRREPI